MRYTLWIAAIGVTVAQAATPQPAYDVKNEVTLAGRVSSVTTMPDWMGQDGLNIALSTTEGGATPHIDVSTAGFLRTMGLPLAVGDDVTLKGAWGQSADGGRVFLVHEIKKAKVTLNVRDPSGHPLW